MYDFSTLNDKDLEILALDLLNRNFDLKFQSFKVGKDKGIDLRFSTINDENDIVVQVKHYLQSGFAALKQNIKKQELSKVKVLNPKRYILVTSIGLSPPYKEELKEILSPFILTTQDIFGQDELNSLLRDYEEIETKHFKLWLSSTNVLDRIMQNGILGRSEFAKQEILNKVKLFVPNETFNKAIALFNENKFVLITGAPGIGKTMLANMLTFLFLAKGYELIHVFEVKEAEERFKHDRNQIFYFDDFLGANYSELYVAKNNDSAIVHFLNRIQASSGKRLILTSRTIVLNKAKTTSEKLSNSKLDVSKYEVKIEDYSLYDKARILYNHIYFSLLNEEILEVFFKDSFYWGVIQHRNYFPRIIEFITDSFRFDKKLIPADYKKQVIYKLENPEDVWKSSYENQISENAKLLLNTIFSLSDKNEDKVKKAFNARIVFEINNNGFKKSRNIFEHALKELLGGYLKRTIFSYSSGPDIVRLEFFDPSIADFLLNYFSISDKEEKWDIFNSAIYLEQFNYRFKTKLNSDIFEKGRIVIGKQELAMFMRIFIEKHSSLKPIFNISDKNLIAANIMFELFELNKVESHLFKILNEQQTKTTFSLNFPSDSILLLENLEKHELIDTYIDLVKSSFVQIVENLDSLQKSNELKDFLINSRKYSNLLKNEIENDEDFKIVIQTEIDNFWNAYYLDSIQSDSLILNVLTEEELTKSLDDFEEQAKGLNHIFNVQISPALNNSSIDISDMVAQNRDAQISEADNNSKLGSIETQENYIMKMEKEKINDLFSKDF